MMWIVFNRETGHCVGSGRDVMGFRMCGYDDIYLNIIDLRNVQL